MYIYDRDYQMRLEVAGHDFASDLFDVKSYENNNYHFFLHEGKLQFVVLQSTLAIHDYGSKKVTFGAIINRWC